MKTTKLLEKLSRFLDSDGAGQRAEIASIRKILKKLKAKEKHLRETLEDEADPELRAELQARLDVVHAQRTKGVARVRDLRAEMDPDGKARSRA